VSEVTEFDCLNPDAVAWHGNHNDEKKGTNIISSCVLLYILYFLFFLLPLIMFKHGVSNVMIIRPCLIRKNFQDFPSHRIFSRMHGALNINENKN